MKFLIVVLALAVSACATAEGKLAIGRGAGPAGKVDAEAVQGMVDDGRDADARYYLTKCGLGEAEIIATIEKAKKAKKDAEAQAAAAAAARAAKESK
jgi:hypothetical protein